VTRKKPANLTRLQAAKALGVGRASLERLISAGRLLAAGRSGKRHTYSRAAVEALAVELANERRGREGAVSARERKDLALAILTELRIEKERGALVLRDAADGVLATWQAAVRAAILRLPTDAIRRGVPRDHETLLRQLVEDVLHAVQHTHTGGHDAKEV
jgi:hypothetical protein